MVKLEDLYFNSNSSGGSTLCSDCSILSKNKPAHSIMDFEGQGVCDILFISGSVRYQYGESSAFSKPEWDIITEALPNNNLSIKSSAAVKCPSVKEADMSPSNMKICREFLEKTIDQYQPKLVFPCGNLAMKMLIKKSGITDKRGKSFKFISQNDQATTVVPIFHPFAVIQEPRHKYLFETDIKNAIDKYIYEKLDREDFTYKVVMSIKDLDVLCANLLNTSEPVACDIETTGLNFLTDDIMSISFSTQQGTVVVPLDHKDSPFTKEEKPHVWVVTRKILENTKNKKIFHNAKFDVKFLINHGIYPKNIYDTKIMHHLINENAPKSLMDLVKLYFPTELENL